MNLLIVTEMYIQLKGGYHISDSDYEHFKQAVSDINNLYSDVTKEYIKSKGV